ncbi:MAG: hypothetical protein AAB320_02150 [Elusimicrobiota bacterium]
MKRQRCHSAPLRPVFWAAALFLAQLTFARPAAAVQLFINSAFVHAPNSNCTALVGPPPKFLCPDPVAFPLGSQRPGNLGNISNEPHIEFERAIDANACFAKFPGASPVPGLPTGSLAENYCNFQVFLCASIGYANETNTAVALNMVQFEVFKFGDGSNALDPGSTPPLRTYFIDAPGVLGANCNSEPASCGVKGPYCVLFDGSANVQGELAKTNGQYGFRATVQTNTTGASGNITITAVRAYPSGATRDANLAGTATACPITAGDATGGCFVSQKPVTVDVTNVHVVRSSPTIIGSITGVAVQPYSLTYRLSKDATMYITVSDVGSGSPPVSTVLRNVVSGLPRIGEGVPQGTLQNGDTWNGRSNNGDLMPPGVFLATLQAQSFDQYGPDLSEATTRQISIDPLQVTDVRIQPLLAGSTSLAVLTYELTEPATAFIDIYPPGTQFCNGLNNVNSGAIDQNAVDGNGFPLPPKNFLPILAGNCGAPGAAISPLKRLIEQKNARTGPVVSFWDGRDTLGRVQDDGDYVFVIYAALASQNGFPFNGVAGDRRIWTSVAKSGFLPIIRGFVGISQVSPGASVIGSSPAISGLNPFIFRYTLTREANVSMKIFDSTGLRLVKTLVNNATRPGLFPNSERWDEPIDNSGNWVSSGTYLVQLTAADPLLPAKVSTTTALFPLDSFRITDVAVTPLLAGTSDLVILNYQLSQSMNMAWNIYPPGTQIVNTTTTWPPCSALVPATGCNQILTPQGQAANAIVTFQGLRPGRLRISEFWDGRDGNGLFVPDGNYVFTLAAQSTSTPKYFASDRVTGSVTVARGAIIFSTFRVDPDVPILFNSSATITLHPFTITYAVTRQSSVTLQIMNSAVPPAVVRTLFSGSVKQGGIALQDVWDGKDDRGNFPPSGFYLVRAIAQDVASVLSSGSTSQLTISFDPLRIYDVAVTPLRADSGAEVHYQVSETMKVAVKIFRPGTFFDLAGNPSPPESTSLIKRIVGVRPARTEIVESWDGTDLRFGIAPDGNYKFKIVASTDATAIDTLTGNVVAPGALSLDKPIDDIPVVRAGSIDPRNDFDHNTYIFPNPVTGASANFVIWTPFQAKVKMKVFTLSGEQILDKDFGEWPAQSYVLGANGYVWNKTNQSGRKVARGLYYAVIRVEESLGGKNVFQSIKKVLVP